MLPQGGRSRHVKPKGVGVLTPIVEALLATPNGPVAVNRQAAADAATGTESHHKTQPNW